MNELLAIESFARQQVDILAATPENLNAMVSIENGSIVPRLQAIPISQR